MTERTLDRLVSFDPRSRQYPVRTLEAFNPAPRTRTWPLGLRLDQGREGACVGYSRAHDLAAHPKPARGITDSTARDLYYRAQRLDEWPGENYEGTSVLGGVKAARELGYVGEYRWTFSVDDLIGALGHVGPVVLGTSWLTGMFDPRPDGTMDVTGSVAGGHAYLARGVSIPYRGKVRPWRHLPAIAATEPMIRVVNSWNWHWGVNGECLISAPDMQRLLADQGEGCVSTVAFGKPRA